MKILHIYDYDGVFTDPRKGSDHPDPRVVKRLEEQVLACDKIAISTGRNFNELLRLGAIDELQKISIKHQVQIPIITEKGMVIDVINSDGKIESIPNMPGILPMSTEEINQAEILLSQIISHDKYSKAKKIYEIELCKKRTFFSVILTVKDGVAPELSIREVLETIHSDILKTGLLSKYAREDLHLEITGKAIDLQTNAHIKSNGSVQLMKYLENSVKGYHIISYGDSSTDIDILTTFKREHKVLHVHVGPADRSPKSDIKIVYPKQGLYSDGLGNIPTRLGIEILP